MIDLMLLADERFAKGIRGLLKCGDIRLLRGFDDVPRWQWREILSRDDFTGLNISLTAQGSSRVT